MSNVIMCSECRWFSECGNRCNLHNNRYLWGSDKACKDFDAIPKPTNGDCTRRVDNKGLAYMFANPCPPGVEKKCKGNDRAECERCWLSWLNAPAGEDNNVPATRPAEDKKDYDLKALNFIYNKQAEATRFKRALHNLKEDCTRRKHFAVSYEEKLFLTETISHIESELDYAPATAEKGGEDEP